MMHTMSIASLGPSTLEDSKPRSRFPNGIKKSYDNIEQDGNRIERILQNHTTFNSTADIFGASPKLGITHSRNCFHTLLEIDDIEGTRCKQRDKMLQTQRNVNPLNPSYSLPTFVPPSLIEPKFLRNTMAIDDIDGAQTKKRFLKTVRDTLSTKDISGAEASWRPRHSAARLQAPPHDIMSVGIEVRKRNPLSSQVTDYMDPHYFIYGSVIEDEVKYTKPSPLKTFIPDNHLLKTNDIHGATSKSNEMSKIIRREFRNTNYLGDIRGAQADTIKHSIVTQRITNPLNPNYPGLDDGRPLVPPVSSLIPSNIITTPTVHHKKFTDSNTTTSHPVGVLPLDLLSSYRSDNGGNVTISSNNKRNNEIQDYHNYSSRKSSKSLSARRAMEERRTDIEAVRDLS